MTEEGEANHKQCQNGDQGKSNKKPVCSSASDTNEKKIEKRPKMSRSHALSHQQWPIFRHIIHKQYNRWTHKNIIIIVVLVCVCVCVCSAEAVYHQIGGEQGLEMRSDRAGFIAEGLVMSKRHANYNKSCREFFSFK